MLIFFHSFWSIKAININNSYIRSNKLFLRVPVWIWHDTLLMEDHYYVYSPFKHIYCRLNLMIIIFDEHSGDNKISGIYYSGGCCHRNKKNIFFLKIALTVKWEYKIWKLTFIYLYLYIQWLAILPIQERRL